MMVRDLEQYSAWRQGVVAAVTNYRNWVAAADLGDAATDQRLALTLAKLVDDKLSVAFVAEFSRGKSELINSIFFSDYGQRILPSAAGRTTMCPTELMYDPAYPACIRLLPIETRAANLSTSDYREDPSAWTVLPLKLDAADDMHDVFKQVSMTRHVSIEEAKRYGLYDEEDPDMQSTLDSDGLVEISLWRHAIINFPHPLLKQGLVILDTPGLNAIGTEPELTLNLIPHAHAVLFILAADTGVTKSDIEVWRTHIGSGAGRMVVLNKIDSMWDALRSVEEVDAEIKRQQDHAAHMLGLDPRQVFPVSAQKALVGKITGDAELLEKSRMKQLESALFHELIPAKKDIIRKRIGDDLQALSGAQHAMLAARARGVVEQLLELKGLRGKNQSVVAHMMKRVDAEKKEFDESLFKLQATRAVFTRLSTELYSSLGMGVLRDQILAVRDTMQTSRFTTGLRDAVQTYFKAIHANLDESEAKISEIRQMMETMYRKFSAEHGLTLTMPMPFTLSKYREEVAEAEAIYHKQFGTTVLLMNSRVVVMERFFDSVASNVKRCFKAANADADAWLKVIMAPLESQIRQHKEQLKHRQASIHRIYEATDSLEHKIGMFESEQEVLETQKAKLAELAGAISIALNAEMVTLDAAA
jgi:uncharacterized protein YdcH (DUF465 family)